MELLIELIDLLDQEEASKKTASKITLKAPNLSKEVDPRLSTWQHFAGKAPDPPETKSLLKGQVLSKRAVINNPNRKKLQKSN